MYKKLTVLANWGKKNWHHIIVCLFIICLITWCFAKIDRPAYSQPEGGERLSYTPFNDYLILMAADHFAQEGFAHHYFLSNMTVGYPEFARGWYAYQTELEGVPNAGIYYTHYGSIDAIIVGFWQKLGVNDLTILYKIAALFSSLALLIWYITALGLFSRGLAVFSTLIMGSSLIYLHFFDNISVYVYDVLFAFSAVFLFTLAETRPSSSTWARRLLYASAWIFFALLSVNSPEFIPFVAVIGIGYLWSRMGRKIIKRWRTILAIIAAPVVAQLVHFIQVAVALGGIGNAFVDFTSAILRRTTGFELAEEVGYRGYSLWEALSKMESDLWSGFRLEIIILFLLLAVSAWLTWRLMRKSSHEVKDARWSQWRLLLVFFLGGIMFWVVMPQSTVTQSGSAYRTILPFAGLAIGYCIINGFNYLRLNTEKLLIRIALAVLVLAIIAPTAIDRLSGRTFQFVEHDQRLDMYYGIYPEEIKVLGSFLKQSTVYGDIILTDFRVAETGHPRYPFPGYEYESGRRVEYTNNITRAIAAIKEFSEIRDGIPGDNPASGVAFYLLVDSGSIENDFGEFARSVGDLKQTFYTDDYWKEQLGTVPVPYNDSIPFAPRSFYLFRVDDEKFVQFLTTINRESI